MLLSSSSLRPLLLSILLASADLAAAASASSWSFRDGNLAVQSKGSGVNKAKKVDLNVKKPLSKPITLGNADTIKIQFTATENGSPKKPNQAMLLLKEQETGLETFFAAQTRDSGKSTITFSYKDLPAQLLLSQTPLQATLLVASFGKSTGFLQPLFDIQVQRDPQLPQPVAEAQLRYGKKEHIHHTFRQGPKNPPVVLTLVFGLAVLATVPVLFGVWFQLGGNVSSLLPALKSAPLSHLIFFGSILALEGTFLMYYTRWNLFETLPPAAIAAIVAFISGGRALTEVQERRLASGAPKTKTT